MVIILDGNTEIIAREWSDLLWFVKVCNILYKYHGMYSQ